MPSLSNRAVLAIVLLAAAAMLLGTAWVGDDAFITLRVIDNFVHGYGLRYNVLERVQVYTHPLWLMLLTPFYALTREAMVTTMLVSVVLALGAFWLLAVRVARDPGYGCLLVLAAVASRAIYQFATSGLENPLTFLLLALLVWQLPRAQSKWIPAGLVGLLLLNRLDLAVLAGPLAVCLLFQAKGERIAVALAVALPELAWVVFSLVYYGAPLPNTAYAKLGTGYGAGEMISHGWQYTRDFALHDPLLALLIAAAVLAALRSRDWVDRMLGGGIVLYAAYIVMIGGDFMSGRFYAAPGFLALCLLARQQVPRLLTQRLQAANLVGAGLCIVLLAARLAEPRITDDDIPDNGIADERRYYYADNGLLPVLRKWQATGAEPVHPWGQVFQSLGEKARSTVVATAVGIGMRGYYGGRMVHLVDQVGLGDAFLARLPATPVYRVGHYQRLLPPGYIESVASAVPVTTVAPLQPLLHDVTLATRAPLFAAGRWSAIGRLSFGTYNWIYHADIYGPRQ